MEDDATLHPDWWAWLAENLARAAPAEALEDALLAEGVPADQARHALRALLASPMTEVAQRLRRRTEALEQIIDLRARHRRLEVPIPQPFPDVDTFIAQYWCPGVPAVFTDLVRSWPAYGTWSPAYFVERFGDEAVKACVGRDAMVDADPLWDRCEVELSLAAFVARITAGSGNDGYIIAKNAMLGRPGLAPLLDDMALRHDVFGSPPNPERIGLWFGDAGTHTPLHHDGDNTMFCQVVGRKRFRLAPPENLELLSRARGVYSHWSPDEDPEVASGSSPLIDLVVHPGDALFIPAGWWHQVDALDVSISVSIQQFAWPNDYRWYRPGSVLRGPG